MLSHVYFEPLLLIIAQELLVQSQVRASDVIIYISANTYETSHWQECSHSDEEFAKTNNLNTHTKIAIDGHLKDSLSSLTPITFRY